MISPPHPSEILRPLFDKTALTQEEIAKNLGVNRVHLNSIYNGHRGISPEMALKLSRMLGHRPQYWAGLQMEYDLYKASKKTKLGKVKSYF